MFTIISDFSKDQRALFTSWLLWFAMEEKLYKMVYFIGLNLVKNIIYL